MTKIFANEAMFEEVSEAVKNNGGYCCCELIKNDDTKCICKNFRESTVAGACECGRFYRVPVCETVTLCGSTCFKDDFLRVQKELTLKGYIVLSVGLFGHSDDGETYTEETKQMLDDLHKAKIAKSDFIYVINKDGYIGQSTKNEIEFAQTLGKKVVYMEAQE